METPEFDGGDFPKFLAGGGEMAALMRARDWAATALGAAETWPQSLKTAIRIMLTSRQPIWIGWGPDLIFFYNDPYKSIIGGKHPGALGQPTSIVWPEIWPDIGPMLASAMTGLEGTFVEEQLLLMERNGYPEETYYTFSYSPIPDDDGSAGGIICANSEDTRRVIGERQISLLRELAAGTVDARSWRDACDRSILALASNPQDLTFALLYLAEPNGTALSLIGSTGIEHGHSAAPEILPVGGAAVWPIDEVMARHEIVRIDDLSILFHNSLPSGAWSQPTRQAVLLPVLSAGATGRCGVLIVGLNPFRMLDQSYKGFLELAAGQIGAAIGNAEAYEEERRRAEALAEIDRSKTVFFSNISHEFRTPLTLMLGSIEEMLAADGTAPAARSRPLIEVAHRNSLRLLKLVNSLLDFSRIEAGRVQASFEPTDLAGFTAELSSSFRSAMEKAGLGFRVEAPPLPGLVHVDRDMWEKIVLNLLSNAFKFTLAGTVSVEVGSVPDGTGAVLIVRDTGIGIPPEALPRLFERFHRIGDARGRTIEGSGIGLAMVQELVRLHGGTVAVDSTPDQGTAVTVFLPFGTAHLAADQIRPAQPDAGSDAAASMRARAYAEEALRWLPDDRPPSGQDLPSPDEAAIEARVGQGAGARVLVADDNADLRDYMRRLLSADGYFVETVVDGEAALEAARRSLPDLVLSDVMMPRLDGFGLLAALRADEALRETPVLLLSARAGEEARVEGLAAGADDYLTKPFSARELLARVSSSLQLARLRHETEAKLREEARTLEVLNRIGVAVAAELDLDRAVQVVTDAATELTGAAFGSFFYNVLDEAGGRYTLYTLSGAPREAFAQFPMPRNTAVFAPTFAGDGVVRSDDITRDPRYGRNAPHQGMPKGHLAVRSYLAAPVTSRTGEVLGGLFFGHPEPGIFTERSERLASVVAAQAAAAIDNARLYQAAQIEIGERRKAQTALGELNETLEQRVVEAVAERDRLWELSEDLLVVADFDGRLLRVSPSWKEILGLDRATLLARPYAEIIHPEDLDRVRAVLAELRETRRPVRIENRLRTATGGWRWISWTLSPDPERDRMHGVGRDVTADREAAEALRQAEEALRVAQKMEAIGKLTGGVAHDFNNLLQVIGGNLQLLGRDVSGNDKAEQRLRNAVAGVARGSKLASQLLSFGRRQPLAPKVVNLGRFVRGLDDMLRRALGEGIEIETIVSGGLWNTLVDPFQVENALINLGINARDAMGGQGRLTIEAGNALLDDAYVTRHSDVTAGQYVMVAVTDTGSGMSPDVMEHVFEPFFTTKPEGQGTGLGLSMVYGFVKQSNGHIKIYSEPGHGTTVRIYLPRVRQEEDLPTEIEAGPVTGGSETIMVVEDDEEVRTVVVDMLTDLGYRVLKAKDALSALAIIESGLAIDLLFTDVVMPGPLRSPELARKARERIPTIAVLFTSGYTENAIVHGGRLDEGIELLSKPYTREALARKIRHELRNQQQRNGLRQPAAAASPVEVPTGAPTLRILLVEDDELIRMSTGELAGSFGHVVAEVANANEALALLENQTFDVLLTDVGLPGISGLDLAVEARRRLPEIKIVFASGHYDLARPAGLADAYHLRKPYTRQDLAEALR
jgi:PAS domain S-box-containing protein